MGLSTTYTKTETDFLIQQLEKKTASGYKGTLKIADAAPTAQGLYILSDVGTYTNLGGLVATADKLNYAYFDGTTWSLVSVELLTPEQKSDSLSELINDAIFIKGDNLDKGIITTNKFLADGGIEINESVYNISDYIPVTDGEYLASMNASGGASMIGYDINKANPITLHIGAYGSPSTILVPKGISFVRISYITWGYFRPAKGLIDYTRINKELNSMSPQKIYNNYKSSQSGFAEQGGLMISGRYGHIGSAFKMPLNVKRPTVISFKFRIREDINSTTATNEFFKIKKENGDFLRVDLLKGINERYDVLANSDAATRFDYSASIPKLNSGFKFSKNIGGVETEISTVKRNAPSSTSLVGKDAFHIRKNTFTESDLGLSLRITQNNLEIFQGVTVLHQFEIKPTKPVKELTDRLKTLSGYTVETFGIERKLQSDLLKVTDIALVTRYGLSQTVDSFGAYVPYSVDESVHTFELYMDDYLHYVPTYGFTIPVTIFSIDGHQVRANDNIFSGNCELIFNAGVSQIEILDFEIQNGSVEGYERQDDASVATFVSKYSKQILGLTWHFTTKGEYNASQNGFYDYDGSTDRLMSLKQKLDANGFKQITLRDLADYYAGDIDIPNKCFFFTADDIELNIFTDQKIREVFFKANMKPNLALVTGGTYTDGSGRTEHDNINVNDYLTANQYAITDSKFYGWIPHLHGYSHTPIDDFTYASTVSFIDSAISAGIAKGIFVDLWTYSYGQHTINSQKIMEHKGIKLAVWTANFFSIPSTNKWRICRMNASDIDGYIWNSLRYWIREY